MSLHIVQRYCARNDGNGNPRRVYVIRDRSGDVLLTVKERHDQSKPLGMALVMLGIDRKQSTMADITTWWAHHPNIVDIGDVDVAPGIVRRMLKHGDDD